MQAEAGPTVSVEADNNATAIVMKGEDLEALPDDPDDLSDALQALAGPGAGPNGGQIYIDGFSGGQLPPKESIREIRINQNPFSAEFDRLGFGRIEILTKPGTDKLRGMIALNDSQRRLRLAQSAGEPISRITRTAMIGANLGGSLNKKTSFFLDFNRRDITDNSITHATYRGSHDAGAPRSEHRVVTPSGVHRDFAAHRLPVEHQQHADRAIRGAVQFARTTPAWAAPACRRLTRNELAYNSERQRAEPDDHRGCRTEREGGQ